jgi:rod shape-determining protein MreC
MQRIINFIVKFKEYITFASLIVICLALISMGDVSKLGGYRAVIIGTVGWMQEAFAWIPNPGALKSENRAVRELNLRQSAEITRMRHALIENKRLRQMIEFKDDADYEVISAEVVGKNSVEMRNTLTLNRGKIEGITEGMSVRTDAGLAGQIVSSSDNYSLVESIFNRNVRISAKIQRTGIDGIVAWEGDEYLLLKNIPTSFDVQIGDVVLTSNFTNKYPKNVPIGVIKQIKDDPGSLFFKVEIEPYVNFSTIEQVFVMKYIPDEERLELIKEFEEKLIARKKK